MAFKHLAENDLQGMGGVAAAGSRYNGGGDLTIRTSPILEDFFGGRFVHATNLNMLGIVAANMGGVDINDLQNIMNSIYFPTGADDNNLLQRTVIESKIKTKVHFGTCPYIVVIVGRYVPELGGSVYVGAGAVLLWGTLTPENDSYESKSEKFRKIAPQFVGGFEKYIGQNWGVAFEVSQTIKVSQKMSDSEFGGQRTKRSTEISRTTMKLTFFYNL